MASQKRKEAVLSQKLLERCGGVCERCGKWPSPLGLSKHEIIKRSHQGDPLDPANCLMLCGPCHDHEQRHAKSGEVTPYKEGEKI